MEPIDVRAAATGAIGGVVSYFAVFLVAVPALSGMLVAAGPVVTALVVIAAQAVIMLLLGAAVALLVRRRRGLRSRGSAMSTVLTAGGCGLVLVLVLGAAAAAATAQGGITGQAVIVGAVTWLGLPALGAAVVPPREAPRTSYDAPAPVDFERGGALAGARSYGDAGSASLESVGVTTVAVLLIGTLLLVLSPAGGWFTDNLRVALCRIVTLGQGGCGAMVSPSAESHKPKDPCVLSTDNDVRAASLDVVFVTVKGGGTIRVEKLSDGTFRVSAEGSGGAGAQVGVGAGASITIDDHQFGGDAEAQLAGYVEAAGGATWVVDEAGKNKLVDYLKEERNWASVQSAMSSTPLGAIGSGATWAAHGVWNWLTGDSYSPPEPTEIYGQAGIGGTGSANAASVVSGASAEVNVATAIGSRVNVKTGETTLYYTEQIDGSASENVGFAPVHGGIGQAEGKIKVLVAVTIGKDGVPVRVTTQGLAVGDAQAAASTVFTGSLGEPQSSNGRLFTATVDLTGPETSRIAGDLLRATGIMPNGTAVDQVRGAYDALATFTQAARDRGVLTKQDVNSSSNTSFGIQGGGEFGPLELGASFKNSTDNVSSEKGYWWDGQGWRSWAECTA